MKTAMAATSSRANRGSARSTGSSHTTAIRFGSPSFAPDGATEGKPSEARSAGATEGKPSEARSAGATEGKLSEARSADATEGKPSEARSADATEGKPSEARSAKEGPRTSMRGIDPSLRKP